MRDGGGAGSVDEVKVHSGPATASAGKTDSLEDLDKAIEDIDINDVNASDIDDEDLLADDDDDGADLLSD